ncbi:MAG: 50S ribosomal protein L29 [Candidatus Auribacterota bacterium]|jgi:large subunit ribosomal protein L29|uniref:Large ribosomal subunit protein uL29 n=1 Tax=Candidatus Auribacter fodinae TaxID=2093366 RepID=A0A3A4QWU5_9BACT|nr:MAG: 50S ribosomal protein L29 [Candidatus Auribacter fodinae]
MKAHELRQKSTDDLNKLLDEYRRELLNLRIQKKTGQIEKVGRIHTVKKEVARILTILNEPASVTAK